MIPLQKIASYLKPYWKSAYLAPLLMVIEVVCDLFQPTLMAKIVDQGIMPGNLQLIIQTGLLMVGIALVGLAGGAGCTVFASQVALRFAADLRQDLFRRTQSFSFENLDRFTTGSLITRLTNDVIQLQNLVLMMLRVMVRAPLLCLGGISLAVAINPGLAMIILVILPFLAVTLAYVIRKAIPLFGSVQRHLDRVNTVIRENLTGIRVVKAFVRSDYENEQFGIANDQLTATGVKAARLVGLTMPLMFLIMNFGMIAVAWFGGIRVNSGNMQVGQVMAFINYMTQILFSLMMVTFLLMNISRAKASADRIQELLQVEPTLRQLSQPKTVPRIRGGIDFENITFRYHGTSGPPMLRRINFSVLPGQTVAILGATGSGKTTLINLIPRFYDPDKGRVLIDGVDVREYSTDALRQQIGMVMQEPRLFTGTVMENLRWGRPEATEAEVIAAAQATQAHQFISRLAEGYQTPLSQRGVNLSGGQKQRLAIARALVRQPAILILDDSTSAVDLSTEARIQAALKSLPQVTCLLIAQRICSVMAADRILVLENGEIVSSGTHEELLRSSAVYQDIYQSQCGEEAL